jgi:hypothetical protein
MLYIAISTQIELDGSFLIKRIVLIFMSCSYLPWRLISWNSGRMSFGRSRWSVLQLLSASVVCLQGTGAHHTSNSSSSNWKYFNDDAYHTNEFGYNNDAYLSNCSCGVSERCKAMDAHMRSIQNWAALCLALAKVDGLSESELGILGSHIN